MKKTQQLFLCLVFASSLGLQAQTLRDVSRYSNISPQGDGRFMAMGGAFGALGGNVSAMSINPAGSSVFLYPEISVSAQLLNRQIESSYFSNEETSSTDHFRIPQFGGVFVVEGSNSSDWTKLSFGFNIQRVQDFNQTYRVIGNNPSRGLDQYFLGYARNNELSVLELRDGETYGDAYAEIGELFGYGAQQAFLGYQGYMINPLSYTDTNVNYTSNAAYNRLNHDYYFNSTGYHRKYTFNFSTTYKNRFHLGININTHQIEYDETNDLEERGYNSNSGVQFSKFTNELNSLGRGVSMDIGAIVLYNQFRFGMSYQSPTWFSFVDEGKQSLEVDYVENETTQTEIIAPGVINGYPEYELRTPSKITMSAAYTYKKRALIAVDFGTQNPQNSRFEPTTDGYFSALNDEIKNAFVRGSFLRLGTELRLNDQVSLRGGFRSENALQSGALQEDRSYSLGVGYDMGASAVNIALVQSERRVNYELYNIGLTDNYYLNVRPLQIIASYVLRL